MGRERNVFYFVGADCCAARGLWDRSWVKEGGIKQGEALGSLTPMWKVNNLIYYTLSVLGTGLTVSLHYLTPTHWGATLMSSLYSGNASLEKLKTCSGPTAHHRRDLCPPPGLWTSLTAVKPAGQLPSVKGQGGVTWLTRGCSQPCCLIVSKLKVSLKGDNGQGHPTLRFRCWMPHAEWGWENCYS